MTLVARMRAMTAVMTKRAMRKTTRLICSICEPSWREPSIACCVYWMMYVQQHTWAATLKNWARTPYRYLFERHRTAAGLAGPAVDSSSGAAEGGAFWTKMMTRMTASRIPSPM